MVGIQGKVVVITGAGSGIGTATALLLAERGATVVLGARRLAPLAALAQSITAAGGKAAFASIDVTQHCDMQRLIALAVERYGRLDVLINNAGIGRIGRFDALQVKDWDDMIDVNIRGVLYGIHAALPLFRAQGSGHIVNVISTAGLRIVPEQGVYAATKNAVHTITEALRQEAGAGLRVTGVSPGFVKTSFAEHMPEGSARTQVQEKMNDIAIPPDAIARAIAFAIEQPADVDVGDIVVRPTAQG